MTFAHLGLKSVAFFSSTCYTKCAFNCLTLFQSFDSTADIKQRNDDGLVYIDLQFDDKPRSRRPIQIIDNGNPAYADIAMPRV